MQGLKAGPNEDVRGATQAAIKILEGTQVLVSRQHMELADAALAEFGRYGYSLFSDRSNEELEYFLRHHRWPSAEELEHYRKTGNWLEQVVP